MNGMVGTRGREQGGFSFIEIIVAIAVLGGVLVSIASMFILGGRQVKTGKTMTQATTFAHAIMETYDQQSFTALYTGLGGAATGTSLTVYSNVTGSPIASWQAQIAPKLENGVARVDLVPIGSASPLQFGTATALRLTVRINWNELGRPQTVSLSTVRF